MSNDANLIRDEVKILRDGVKSNYKKGIECYICSSTEKLQLHHYSSFAQTWERWKIKNKVRITCMDDIMSIRDSFYEDNWDAVVTNCVTLCSICHNDKLHKIYGKSPGLGTSKKQQRWVEIQRNKAVQQCPNSLD